jgi:hypothetical protein
MTPDTATTATSASISAKIDRSQFGLTAGGESVERAFPYAKWTTNSIRWLTGSDADSASLKREPDTVLGDDQLDARFAPGVEIVPSDGPPTETPVAVEWLTLRGAPDVCCIGAGVR